MKNEAANFGIGILGAFALYLLFFRKSAAQATAPQIPTSSLTLPQAHLAGNANSYPATAGASGEWMCPDGGVATYDLDSGGVYCVLSTQEAATGYSIAGSPASAFMTGVTGSF